MNGIPHSAFRILRHPAWLLAGGVALTQWLGDTFYPFSNFAMYSRLGDEATYVYLADAAGDPISTIRHTSLSAAKVNKMYHSALKDVCQRQRIRLTKATPEARQQAVAQVMAELRKINIETARPPLPGQVTVVEVLIALKNGALTQTPVVAGKG
jgi:hypothetical protein